MSQEERYLLIRVDQNLSNLLDSFTQMRKDFVKHTEDDKSNFNILHRFMWGLAGAGALVAFLFKVIK